MTQTNDRKNPFSTFSYIFLSQSSSLTLYKHAFWLFTTSRRENSLRRIDEKILFNNTWRISNYNAANKN